MNAGCDPAWPRPYLEPYQWPQSAPHSLRGITALIYGCGKEI